MKTPKTLTDMALSEIARELRATRERLREAELQTDYWEFVAHNTQKKIDALIKVRDIKRTQRIKKKLSKT